MVKRPSEEAARGSTGEPCSGLLRSHPSLHMPRADAFFLNLPTSGRMLREHAKVQDTGGVIAERVSTRCACKPTGRHGVGHGATRLSGRAGAFLAKQSALLDLSCQDLIRGQLQTQRGCWHDEESPGRCRPIFAVSIASSTRTPEDPSGSEVPGATRVLLPSTGTGSNPPRGERERRGDRLDEIARPREHEPQGPLGLDLDHRLRQGGRHRDQRASTADQ